jgi:hypothetical protein
VALWRRIGRRPRRGCGAADVWVSRAIVPAQPKSGEVRIGGARGAVGDAPHRAGLANEPGVVDAEFDGGGHVAFLGAAPRVLRSGRCVFLLTGQVGRPGRRVEGRVVFSELGAD